MFPTTEFGFSGLRPFHFATYLETDVSAYIRGWYEQRRVIENYVFLSRADGRVTLIFATPSVACTDDGANIRKRFPANVKYF